jgi:hypothetical protein
LKVNTSSNKYMKNNQYVKNHLTTTYHGLVINRMVKIYVHALPSTLASCLQADMSHIMHSSIIFYYRPEKIGSSDGGLKVA